MVAGSLKRFIHEESGQGITEYGAILAFVALLVGMTFAFGAGFRDAVLQSYAIITAQLSALAGAS